MKSKLLTLALLAPLTSLACWSYMSLPNLIKGSPILIKAEIISVIPVKSDDDMYDTAILKVEEVLKNATKKEIKPGDELLLASASRANLASTAIRYEKGKKGFWILDDHDDRLWATYPGDFQPLDQRLAVIAALKESE